MATAIRKTAGRTPKGIIYLRNPTPQELLAFAKRANFQAARGIAAKHMLGTYPEQFWWDSGDAIHYEMMNELGIEGQGATTVELEYKPEKDRYSLWGEWPNAQIDASFPSVYAAVEQYNKSHELLVAQKVAAVVPEAAWITPNGEVFDAGDGHWGVLTDKGIVNPEYNEDGTEDTNGDYFEDADLRGSYRKAWERGWARVSYDSVQYRGPLTMQQANAIEDLMRQNGSTDVYLEDIGGSGGLGSSHMVPLDGLAKILSGRAKPRRPMYANWYGKLKLAMPLMDEETRQDRGLYYMDIGHNQFSGTVGMEQAEEEELFEEMWAISDPERNGKWEWVAAPANGRDTHFRALQIEKNSFGLVAKGRFEKNKQNPEGEASVVWADLITQSSPQRQEFMKKRVVKMIEEKYGPGVVIWPF